MLIPHAQWDYAWKHNLKVVCQLDSCVLPYISQIFCALQSSMRNLQMPEVSSLWALVLVIDWAGHSKLKGFMAKEKVL